MTTLAPPHSLSRAQLGLLTAPIDRALARSAATLGMMTGVSFTLASSSIEIVPLARVPDAVGSPEEPAIGIYVGMEGEGFGYLLLLLDEPMALQVAALMLGEDPSSIVLEDEMTASALAEAGNVACSSFMNEIGEATDLQLLATPPVVVGDMRGAIMDIALAEIAQLGDEALLIKTQLGRPEEGPGLVDLANFRMLVIPTPDTLTALLDRLGGKSAKAAKEARATRAAIRREVSR